MYRRLTNVVRAGGVWHDDGLEAPPFCRFSGDTHMMLGSRKEVEERLRDGATVDRCTDRECEWCEGTRRNMLRVVA